MWEWRARNELRWWSRLLLHKHICISCCQHFRLQSLVARGRASVLPRLRLPMTMELGYCGLLVLNQGGRNRKEALNLAKREDLITHRVQVVAIQEHDPLLLRPDDHNDWLECMPPVCPACAQMSGLCIRARKSAVESLQLMGHCCLLDGHYKQKQARKEAKTPIMCCRVVFKSFLNRPALTLVNLHFHHMTAKHESKPKAGYQVVLTTLAQMIRDHEAQIVVGDFNSALIPISSELAAEPHNIHLSLKQYAKWDEVSETDPRGKPVRNHDCLGIFFNRPFEPKFRLGSPKRYVEINGAHWPLLMWIGSKPRRSIQARKRRAEASRERRAKTQSTKAPMPSSSAASGSRDVPWYGEVF